MFYKEDTKITNMTVACIMNSKISKDLLLTSFPTIKFTKSFSGGILKFLDGCLLIFQSGRINVTGIKKIETAIKILDRFTLRYPGFVRCMEKRIVNIVAYNKIGLINGRFFSKIAHDRENSYEPELFPAVHIKTDKSNAIFIVFRTGRIILTGVNDPNLIDLYFSEFERLHNGKERGI